MLMGSRKRSPYLLFRGSNFKTMLSMGTPRLVQGNQDGRGRKIAQGLVDWHEEDDS
jgi:hypothetical protein